MRKGVRFAVAASFFLVVGACAVQAQQQPAEGRDPNAPSAPQPSGSAAPAEQSKTAGAIKPAIPRAPVEHKFWDRENDWLFAGVAAGRGLDYALRRSISAVAGLMKSS